MIPYIIKVALVLAGCLVFYKLLLRKETFYRVNRFTLVFCLIFAFALPLVPVPQQLSLRKPAQEITIDRRSIKPVNAGNTPVPVSPSKENVSSSSGTVSKEADSDSGPSISIKQFMTWLFWLYWFGVGVFAISFIFQVTLLLWRAYRNPIIRDGKYRIVEVDGDKAPCSFGNNIFINPEKYDWDTYNQILQHEKVHIRERHTLDILIAELVLIFQWFNPFAWIYRREVESNLEFLTDRQLIEEKIDKASYQLSLVKVSAPHFPLSLTTNYNQSILKKRIAMMNSKRSNLHTAWKYFFLIPVLALLACLLNEPKAQPHKDIAKDEKQTTMDPEGYWFATIKGEKINIMFSDEELKDDKDDFNSHRSFNSTTFKLSDLSSVPRGASGTFFITREAGRMDFTGKFEENTGMGRYKFTGDKSFADYIAGELKEKITDEDQMVFFFINVTKSYLAMLKNEGYKDIEKDNLIAMSALHVDAAFIKSIKDAGFKTVNLEELVSLKALGVDANYIREVREAGYKNIEIEQVISFKAQGIDKDYIGKVKQMKGADEKDDPNDVVTFKAMNIDEEFINSFKAVGFTNLPKDQWVSMKAMGITPEYAKSWQALGYKDVSAEDLVALKSQGVTPEFKKSFEAMGIRNITTDNLVSLKALGITPEFMKSFEAVGFKDLELDQATSLKALNVTMEFIKGFEAVGFKNLSVDEVVSAKATGVTPEYIQSMKQKGFNFEKLQKYVTLKSISEND